MKLLNGLLFTTGKQKWEGNEMNKAPKKIWMSKDANVYANNTEYFNVPYIKANLAYELASLLKEWLENENDDKDWIDYEDRVTAALKAMEEE
jgi:hypothetical protein